jgi:hypothetical protein
MLGALAAGLVGAAVFSIKARAEREKFRASPAVKFMSMALRSLDKSLNATDDALLRRRASTRPRVSRADERGLTRVTP